MSEVKKKSDFLKTFIYLLSYIFIYLFILWNKVWTKSHIEFRKSYCRTLELKNSIRGRSGRIVLTLLNSMWWVVKVRICCSQISWTDSLSRDDKVYNWIVGILGEDWAPAFTVLISVFLLLRLVGCLGFNSPLRQYLTLYRTVSQNGGERGEKRQMGVKMSKPPHPHLLQAQ